MSTSVPRWPLWPTTASPPVVVLSASDSWDHASPCTCHHAPVPVRALPAANSQTTPPVSQTTKAQLQPQPQPLHNASRPNTPTAKSPLPFAQASSTSKKPSPLSIGIAIRRVDTPRPRDTHCAVASLKWKGQQWMPRAPSPLVR
ncbi:uncharacterized protein EHS24_001176 [Apiotrichum porosum]|uniref:Uncharacterized protein n=1 Tax=Apiotrichum porosum TaxID=105984 RepID=A0A427XJY4_9TREE|nr:uncharacterized protein EHS24_001176 [Apiotrichum porosum]RSH79138.1 hypothetical protein EHS24_001176 [Apiotrichum porosum]